MHKKNVIQISTDCGLKKKTKKKTHYMLQQLQLNLEVTNTSNTSVIELETEGKVLTRSWLNLSLRKKNHTRHNGFLIRIHSNSWPCSSAGQHFTVKMSRGDKQDVVLTSLYANTILPVLCSVAWKVKLPRL